MKRSPRERGAKATLDHHRTGRSSNCKYRATSSCGWHSSSYWWIDHIPSASALSNARSDDAGFLYDTYLFVERWTISRLETVEIIPNALCRSNTDGFSLLGVYHIIFRLQIGNISITLNDGHLQKKILSGYTKTCFLSFDSSFVFVNIELLFLLLSS